MAGFFEKLGGTDRRVIFILMALAVIVPLALKVSFPIPVGEGPSKDLFDHIATLPQNSNVLISFDYGPSTMPELQPMAVALLQDLFSRDFNVVGMALWPQGVSLGQNALSEVGDSLGMVQYEDWVNLGYKTGGMILIARLGTDLTSSFPQDKDGVLYSDIPLLRNISKLSDFDLIISLSAGDPGIPAWVMMAGDRFEMVGLLGGLKGAADYETMVREGVENAPPGTATPGMAAQSIAHLVIMVFIVIGNIAYFSGKRRKGVVG